MGTLKNPPAVGTALARNQPDRFCGAVVGLQPGGAEVVEAAQHVVVIAVRERELAERWIDDLTGRESVEHPALEEVFLAAAARVRDLGDRAIALLEREQSLEHVDRRVEGAARRAVLLLAVPAAVGHLLAEESRDEVARVVTEVASHSEHAAVDARLDLAVKERPVVPPLPGHVLCG